MSSIVIDFGDELRSLRDQLAIGRERLVLVESCTAGLASGLIGQIPGISQYLCGSMVVYRTDSKHQWLGIDQALLEDPAIGPVSPLVTEKLALAVLERTPEATLAAAVTGHLGPDAPPILDGRIFTCIVRRHQIEPAETVEHRLVALPPCDAEDWRARQQRQIEAVQIVISELSRMLKK